MHLFECSFIAQMNQCTLFVITLTEHGFKEQITLFHPAVNTSKDAIIKMFCNVNRTIRFPPE